MVVGALWEVQQRVSWPAPSLRFQRQKHRATEISVDGNSTLWTAAYPPLGNAALTPTLLPLLLQGDRLCPEVLDTPNICDKLYDAYLRTWNAVSTQTYWARGHRGCRQGKGKGRGARESRIVRNTARRCTRPISTLSLMAALDTPNVEHWKLTAGTHSQLCL